MGSARKECLWVTVGMFIGEERLFVNKFIQLLRCKIHQTVIYITNYYNTIKPKLIKEKKNTLAEKKLKCIISGARTVLSESVY